MKRVKFLMPVVFLAIAALLSAAVMLLWNWLMPALFGLIVINFWQALGLLVLARILFGSFGHGRKGRHGRMMHGMHGNNPLREKWMKMTDEERKEFIKRRRAHFHGRFGGSDFFGECGRTFEAENTPKKDNE